MQSASPPLHLLFIHTRIESIPPTLPFRASIQQQVRDAICKALYSRLWQSVIRSLNQYLDVSNDKAGVESMGLHCCLEPYTDLHNGRGTVQPLAQ